MYYLSTGKSDMLEKTYKVLEVGDTLEEGDVYIKEPGRVLRTGHAGQRVGSSSPVYLRPVRSAPEVIPVSVSRPSVSDADYACCVEGYDSVAGQWLKLHINGEKLKSNEVTHWRRIDQTPPGGIDWVSMLLGAVSVDKPVYEIKDLAAKAKEQWDKEKNNG